MTLRAHFESTSSAGERRGGMRRKLKLGAVGRRGSGAAAEVLIHDLSANGMLVETADALEVGEGIEVELPYGGVHRAKVVWSSGRYRGCQFADPLPPGTISAALLKGTPTRHGAPAGRGQRFAAAAFGPRVATLRAHKGMTIEQLARRLKVSRQAVWYWETGQRRPKPGIVSRIADQLEVSEAELLDVATALDDTPGDLRECKQQIAARLGLPIEKIKIIVEL